ncbi:hypothetical protein Hanom_Chr14g01311801 [Helianthus anomalus]
MRNIETVLTKIDEFQQLITSISLYIYSCTVYNLRVVTKLVTGILASCMRQPSVI